MNVVLVIHKQVLVNTVRDQRSNCEEGVEQRVSLTMATSEQATSTKER